MFEKTFLEKKFRYQEISLFGNNELMALIFLNENFHYQAQFVNLTLNESSCSLKPLHKSV